MMLPFHKPPTLCLVSSQPGGPRGAGLEGGPYLRELSDETSRSESSVSLGGGGGSLSGTAVKAGDFLEKIPAVTLGQGEFCLRQG